MIFFSYILTSFPICLLVSKLPVVRFFFIRSILLMIILFEIKFLLYHLLKNILVSFLDMRIKPIQKVISDFIH